MDLQTKFLTAEEEYLDTKNYFYSNEEILHNKTIAQNPELTIAQQLFERFVVQASSDFGINTIYLSINSEDKFIDEMKYELVERSLKMLIRNYGRACFEGAKYKLIVQEDIIKFKILLTETSYLKSMNNKKFTNQFGAWKFVNHPKGDYLTAIFDTERYRKLKVTMKQKTRKPTKQPYKESVGRNA
jgi:hypothetical protein